MSVLYEYQQDGVLFAEKKKGRVLIADEMGLGKTIQAISYLYRNKRKALPVVIVCPSSLKRNWQIEITKWTRMESVILEGEKPKKKKLKGTKIIIINYEILQFWVDEIRSVFKYKTVVLDEAHYVKNPKAIRSKAVAYLVKETKHILCLTGTPIESKPIELFNILKLIRPKLFPNYMKFALRYCGAKRGAFGWEMNGASNVRELHKILKKTLMIRRLKKDVLKDLPPKTVAKVGIEIDNREEYNEAENNFIAYVADKVESDIRKLNALLDKEIVNFDKNIIEGSKISDAQVVRIKEEKIEKITKAPYLIQIEYLKQLAVQGKMKKMIEWIDLFLESGEKLIIFATHRKVIEDLYTRYRKIAVKLYGATSPKKRQSAVDTFQNDPEVKVFIGNFKAAGVGITLTAASNVLNAQYPWNPSDLSQSSDRAHRITQTKQVTIWNLVGVGTIEEKIIDLLQEKQTIIDQILDGRKPPKSNILSELVQYYKNK
jgi:SWI/SNF-related matrix-associated actin-dependent regulator 1 of chromatin subfamily A